MFKAYSYIVASSGTYSAHAFSKSPKKAVAQARDNAWKKLMKGDSEKQQVSGIAVEGDTLYNDTNKVIWSQNNL